MAGDPKQLPPTVVSTLGLQCQLDKTLFERLSVSNNFDPPPNRKPLHAMAAACCAVRPPGGRGVATCRNSERALFLLSGGQWTCQSCL